MYKKTNNTNLRRNYDTCGTYSNEQFDECDFERFLDEYSGSNQLGRNEGPKKCHRRENEECENTVNIINRVCINQSANANGGDGGDGGDAESKATGGSAAAASGLIAIAANVTDPEIEIPLSGDLKNEEEKSELETEQAESSGATAAGGSATVGTTTGGDGGNGGAGGAASNSATVSIENVVIIACNSDLEIPPTVTIGTNGRTLDIKVDKNGDTFVNGEKMDEKKLSDGTKVLIFRSSQSEKS